MMHPLTSMITMYCQQYAKLREDNLDLPPLAFHRSHGLMVHAPINWNILESVDHVIDTRHHENVVVIFGSSESYRKIHDVLKEGVSYLSWHEIFTGIHTASTDIRYLARSKQLLSTSGLTFFLDPPSIPEVMDQVCGLTANCLIVLSGGGV